MKIGVRPLFGSQQKDSKTVTYPQARKPRQHLHPKV